MRNIRILIVADNVSMRMGGEASLPYYYAKLFLRMGADVWIACHERVRVELLRDFPDLEDRIALVPDKRMHKLLHRISGKLPPRIGDLIIGMLIHINTQQNIRAIASKLARENKIDIIFEPSPIAAKAVSFMYDLGVPHVIGPLCGGMEFPPGFRHMDSLSARFTIGLARSTANLINRLIPGKIKADVVLVANQRTRLALPVGVSGQVIEIFESGVDLEIWKPAALEMEEGDNECDIVRFAFAGRFVDWKGVKFLLHGFARAATQNSHCRLELIGGGELESSLRYICKTLEIDHLVSFHGWVDRESSATILRNADVFVMPSLRECGGTAILEAMALGKPVIATDWGGPADYVDDTCGILVDPVNEEEFIEGLASAVLELTRSSELRERLGKGARARIGRDFLDWQSKADRVYEILADVVERRAAR